MTDQIDLSAVSIHNSPDVRSWPVTVQISQIDQTPQGGYVLTFDRPLPDAWKWPTGNNSDNYQYTVWLVVPLPDGYHAEGFIEMWQGRPMGDGALPSILRHYGPDGWLGHLGGPMTSYQPKAGDRVGLLVSAGDARNQSGVTSVAERSNVVVIDLPADDQGRWTFGGTTPTPTPTPTPMPPPPVPPAPPAPGDLAAQLAAIADRLTRIEARLAPDYVGETSLPFLGHVTIVLKPKV